MLDFPKGETFGIVFHTVRRELWRPGVKTFRDRRGRGFALCRAMADRAALPIELDGGDEIFVGHRDRIGALSLAMQGGIQRCLCRPSFQPRRGAVRIRRNDTVAQDEIPAHQCNDDSHHDAEHECSEHHDPPLIARARYRVTHWRLRWLLYLFTICRYGRLRDAGGVEELFSDRWPSRLQMLLGIWLGNAAVCNLPGDFNF